MDIGATGTCKREGAEQELLLEGEKMKRKLQKVQQRRDHYARLYYQAIVELDATRVALSRAMAQITELQAQAIQNSSRKPGLGSNTTSPDSGASLSPGIDPLTRQIKATDHTFSQQIKAGDHTYEEIWMHTQEQQPMPIRAPTGCPAPPAFSNQLHRRSFSLSQQDPVSIPEPPVNGNRNVALSQDCSFAEPKKFERVLSMPQRIHRPLQVNAPKLTSLNGSTYSTESDQYQLSAFKQLSPQVKVTPHRQITVRPNSLQHTSLVCDRSEMSLNSLSSSELLTVYSQLSTPNCRVKKLELVNCGLGQPQNMKLFCNYLVKNKSLVVLSLPYNGIGVESLSMLLDSLQHCPAIKELLLRHNLIDQKCVTILKEFLEWATIDALVLTGNGIEQQSHLLDDILPKEFSMECGRQRDTRSVESQDSGVPATQDPLEDNELNERENPFPLQSNFKDLHI